MIECSVNGLTKYYGANKIFEHISLDLKTNERVGLIGQNGCGKSTLIKIIMGIENYEEGSFSIRKDAKVGYLNQIPVYEPATLTSEVIYMAFEDARRLKNEMIALEKAFKQLESDELTKALNQYGRLCEQFEVLDGYNMDTKVNKIIEGLKIRESLMSIPFESLSGGEKTRVILAKILLEQPDILLLDEPTNHLDLEAIEWLEIFLKDYKGAVLVVSHDRYFLDSVVSRIIELEFDEAVNYQGNYSYYVAEKERRFLIAYKHYLNQQKKIANMERQIERYRIWGAMRDSDKMYRRAKELEKRLEKVNPVERPIFEKRKVRFDTSSVNRSGKIVLEAEGISKNFSNKELFSEVGFVIYYQDSVCLIGGNGSGKTTLLKIIIDDLQAESGIIKLGSRVKIGYLPQSIVYENEELTVLEYFAHLHSLTLGEARSQLAKVLFIKEDVNKKIKSLSGGEKSRLKLCSLTLQGVNFMILDEPTNHLDIDSREVLEETLMKFDGTLLVVSHDRYFINKIADRMMVIEQKGIEIYEGDYNYYLEAIKQKEPQKSLTLSVKKKSNILINRNEPLNIKNETLKSLEMLERQIETKERALLEIESDMMENGKDPIRLEALFIQKQELQEKLEKDYEEWENLQTNVEESSKYGQ